MKRRSLGHSLADALRNGTACVTSNLEPTALSEKRIHRTRVEIYPTKVLATFPLKHGEQILDLTFLRQLPNLVDPLAEGFRTWGSANSAGSRYEAARSLERGIVKFLSADYAGITLAEIDTTVLTAFLKWLDRGKTSLKSKATNPNYRRSTAGTFRVVLMALIGHPSWGKDVENVLVTFPQRTHPNASTKTVPRNRLTREHLEAIDAAAQREVIDIRKRIAEGQRLIEEGNAKLAVGNRDFSDLAIMLAEISKRYPNVLPDYKRLKRESPDLYEWAYRSNKRNHGFGITTLGSYLYASSRDLVPIVLLLTIEGGFNAEAVLALEGHHVKMVDRLGVPSIRVSPPKPRASTSPVKYLDPAWVSPWFETVEYLTRRLRPLLDDSKRDRIFVYAQRWGEERQATTFLRDDRKGTGTWGVSLKDFITTNNIEKFSLSQIRPTESDEIGQAHGSLAASQALNHVSLSTTEKSYLSSGTREREGEQLLVVVDQMRRWVQSGGRIDTRREKRTPTMDRGAATPGYSCADPYDSPRQGQLKNQLCAAYGECPSCELSIVSHDEPISVAYYLALRGAILAGQTGMTPKAWLTKWAAILIDLQAQLGLISVKAIHEAQRFRVHLPPVG